MNTQIQTNNKLIAEFMEYAIIDQDGNHKDTNYSYHESWDWLMPVLAQIKETERNGNSDYNHLMHTTVSMLVNNGLEATYNHVLRFIKWYNDTKAARKRVEQD